VKNRHWNSLIATLRHGQCVLVLGPEIPARREGDSTAPTPGEEGSFAGDLARALAGELEDDNRHASGRTLAALAQQYEDSDGFGPSALRATAERFYHRVDYTPSEVHATLAALPFPLILTTCHDALLTRALRDAGKTPIVQRYHLRGDKRENPEFLLSGAPQTPVVFHLFGAPDEPSSLVLSENDILDFLIGIVAENPPLPNSLLRVLKRPGQSYLFVGFGIRHWHLRVLLKVILRALALNRSGSSIAAEPLRGLDSADRDDTILFYQRGMRVEVEDSDVGTFLETLAAKLNSEGGFVGQGARVAGARVFISYAREDEALASRVHAALQRAHFEPWLDRSALTGGEDWDLRIESELQATDFTLVLYTPAFCRKTDSYVNRELAQARRRALNVRGPFLIPLRTQPVADADRVLELGEYQEMELRVDSFDDDMAKVVSTLTREFQRRNR
jgi:hypothetical protein